MRIVLKAACLLAIAGLALVLARPMCADSLTLKIEQGKIHGKMVANGKVKAFLGLPYAAAPLGDLRWQAPRPPAKWSGVREATQYGSRCIPGQPSPDMQFLDSGPSEDCLFINVYAPADSTQASKLPVMVWIHGGGYFSGAGAEPRHNPDFLVPKGVLLVTFNYRLDVLGFLAATELVKEAGGTAGNYGFMDQIAALEWVKDNIVNFGGDPGNVTIFGESAGSGSVSTMMASPMAKGLFQKAIGESGAAFGVLGRSQPLEKRAQADSEWVASLGVKSLAELRAMPADKLREASLKKGRMAFPPDVDGKVLVEPVPDAYAAGRQAHIPLLAGWNADEGATFGHPVATAAEWQRTAESLFKDRAAEFLKLYPGETDSEAHRSSIDYGGDASIGFSTWKWIEAQCETGQSAVYRYHFELPSPDGTYFKGGVAAHAYEIEYVFGTLDTRPGAVWRPEDRKLSEQMTEYWTNFAKTGDPNGAGLPAWPRYDKDGTLIHLNSTITTGPDTARARYEFLLKGMPSFRF
jgi:para-nitrobenzyl esterase